MWGILITLAGSPLGSKSCEHGGATRSGVRVRRRNARGGSAQAVQVGEGSALVRKGSQPKVSGCRCDAGIG